MRRAGKKTPQTHGYAVLLPQRNRQHRPYPRLAASIGVHPRVGLCVIAANHLPGAKASARQTGLSIQRCPQRRSHRSGACAAHNCVPQQHRNGAAARLGDANGLPGNQVKCPFRAGQTGKLVLKGGNGRKLLLRIGSDLPASELIPKLRRWKRAA